MKSIIDGMRLRFGTFLEACGKALKVPTPGIGQLATEWADVEEMELYRPQRTQLKVKIVGNIPLTDVIAEMPNGKTLVFHKLVISELLITADLLPVFDDTFAKLFSISEADQPVIVKLGP